MPYELGDRTSETSLCIRTAMVQGYCVHHRWFKKRFILHLALRQRLRSRIIWWYSDLSRSLCLPRSVSSAFGACPVHDVELLSSLKVEMNGGS